MSQQRSPNSATFGGQSQQKMRRRWLDTVSRHPLLSVGGTLFCLFAVLWASSIDVVLPFSLLLSTAFGFLFASVLVHNGHLCFCAQIVLAQLVGLLPSDDALSERRKGRQQQQQQQMGDEAQRGRRGGSANGNYIVPPWERLQIDERLNRELEELFETLLESYVSSWYTGLISTDTAFLLEVRHLVRHSSAKLINRLLGVDMHSLLVNDLFPLVLAHLERICRLTDTLFGHEKHLDILQISVSLVEFKVFDHWADDVHWAMRSNANHDAYLRMVADLLVQHFVDDIRIGGCFVDEEHATILSSTATAAKQRDGNCCARGDGAAEAAISPAATKWSCHSSRHFLRELLFSSVLIPALDTVSEPDSLNRLMLNALSDSGGDGAVGGNGSESAYDNNGIVPTVADGGSTERREEGGTQRDRSPNRQVQPFLGRFVEPYYTNTPDSLLGLKLNDLVENPYLTKLFEMYLRDLNGPTHLLDCFVQARDIHMRIQMLNSVKFGNGKCQNGQRLKQEMSEICFDSWQLFSTFVHSNGPNRIPFDGQIEREFSAVLESYKSTNSMSETDQNVNCEHVADDEQEQKRNLAALKPLEKVIEAIYQQVYHNLQYNYVIPFWQSENYLGYLCGAPPDVDELIGGISSDDGTSSARKPLPKMPEGSFSLAQFRNKLFNFITPSKESVPASSSVSSSSMFRQWSFSSANAIDEFAAFATPVDSSLGDDRGGGGSIAMADLSRDMAKWSVSIDGVAQRRAADKTFYYIYSLSVERNDLPDECYTAPTPKTAQSRQFYSPLIRAEEVEEDELEDEEIDGNLGEENGAEEEEELPKCWTVGHRCEEFFALEDRLREYSSMTGGSSGSTSRMVGNSGGALPDRKTTLQLLHNGRNNRALLETYRVHFERFLQQMLQQPNMKRSDLLYIFLTSEENSTGLFELTVGAAASGNWRSVSGSGANFLPDLNPIRAMRKVGGKERGQNLKPFILNLLANTLAPPTMLRNNSSSSNNMTVTTATLAMQKQRSSEQSIARNVDTMSLKSETGTVPTFDVGSVGRRALSSLCPASKPLHGTTSVAQFPDRNRFENESLQQQNADGNGTAAGWTGNFYDLFLFLSLHLGLIARFPFWVESLLCSLRTFVGLLFSIFFRRKTAQILDDKLLNVDMAIYLVRSLHELILFQNVPSSLSATPSQNSMASSAPLGKPTATEGQKLQQRWKATNATAEKQQTLATASEKLPAISEQERKLRAELALHCVEKWVERTLPVSPFLRWAFGRFASAVSSILAETFEDETDQIDHEEINADQNGATFDGKGQQRRVASIRLLFHCFQMPTLNRQLAFVLMDKLLQKIVVERPQDGALRVESELNE